MIHLGFKQDVYWYFFTLQVDIIDRNNMDPSTDVDIKSYRLPLWWYTILLFVEPCDLVPYTFIFDT